MFDYWKKIDGLNQMNRLLLVAIAVLILFIASLVFALIEAPKKMEFWLSPAMSSNGGLMTASEVPDEYVHGFVASLIPTLNTWSKSGKDEFANNLTHYHYYFTSRHQKLLKDTLTVFQDAQLFNRVQVASLYRFLEPGDIKRIGKGVWEVHIVLRITQRLTNKSTMVIADKVVDYHLRVVKVTLSRLLNPYQLALDGYTQPEFLVEDLLSQDLSGEKNAL
ncbi:MAG: DUF2895 family protein [Tatlockia sp.]|nr:DUF2895 family protein [Tatlockia sp.]